MNRWRPTRETVGCHSPLTIGLRAGTVNAICKPTEHVILAQGAMLYKKITLRNVVIGLTLALSAGVSLGDQAAPAATAASAAATARPSPYRNPIAVPSAADMGRAAPAGPAPPATEMRPAPAFTASCDSSGCWGSDGTRYNAVGGMLTRPDGKICRDVAGAMQCP